ncbi:MAG TPA: hypothetical protein VND15_04525 [Candidatus Acidoferrales bacterium]|nr:hypothetical protein [Candidatus Acidoferrales bacterium]
MALMEKDKVKSKAPKPDTKKNPKAELEAEIAEKGFAIREIGSSFMAENKALLSRLDLLQVKMLFNHVSKLSVPELVGFKGPVIILFKRDRRNAAGIWLEERFKSVPSNQEAYKKSTLGRWMHDNLLYTAIELEALKRIYGEKNYYTKEEYKYSYSTVKNLMNCRYIQAKKSVLPIPHFTGVDKWANMLRTNVEEEVRTNGFAIMPCIGIPDDADRESLGRMGMQVVKSTLGMGHGPMEHSTARALGFSGPTAIFFKESGREALCNELESRFFKAFPLRTHKDSSFYSWLYRSGMGRGICTSRGKRIARQQQY